MRLSILIPTYNQNCTTLVKALARQLPEDSEIVIADDCSQDESIRCENRKLSELPQVVYWESEKNIGRAAIRNRLSEISKGGYLLFIDSDAIVESSDFIQCYLSCLPTSGVVCGGIHHPDVCPSPQVSLRWKYEKFCEPLFTAEQRNKNPYQNLRSFNMLMQRQVAQQHPFDATIKQYGYEDTLLGHELQHSEIPVLHIDNPLTNGDIETNDIFLKKTEESLKTLFKIRKSMSEQSRLLKYIKKLHQYHLVTIIRLIFRLTKGALRYNLLGYNPSVQLLQFYKLGYYLELKE